MIIDLLKNAALYKNIDEKICKALDYLASQDFTKIESGRYDIDGDNIYAMVQRYETKPQEDKIWEAHRRYIDVQYVVSGIESMGYAHLDNLSETQAYSDETDYCLLTGSGDYVTVSAGMFVIFFPEDAHNPGQQYESSSQVVKVVVKVLATND